MGPRDLGVGDGQPCTVVQLRVVLLRLVLPTYPPDGALSLWPHTQLRPFTHILCSVSGLALAWPGSAPALGNIPGMIC